MIPLSAPKVEIITQTETRTAPREPSSTAIMSEATRGERPTVSTGRT